VTKSQRVGVDVERVRPIPEADGIVQRFFSAAEQAALRSVSSQDRIECFCRWWTVKEAILKAVGGGLTLPLDQFEFSLGPGQPARLVCVGGDADHARGWSVVELQPAEGYVAAVAVESPEVRLCWQHHS